MFWPCETRTSTCRNFATISSGLYRFLAITVLLDVKDIPQVGPLQWGRISPSEPTQGFNAASSQSVAGSERTGLRIWVTLPARHAVPAIYYAREFVTAAKSKARCRSD